MGSGWVAPVLAALVTAGFLGLLAPGPTESASVLEEVIPGLDQPTAFAFAPDGRIFLTERLTGDIRLVKGGVLLTTPFYSLAGTVGSAVDEEGLLGLALDPNFATDPWVYAYHTYLDPGNSTVYNRVVRIFATGDVGAYHEVVLAPIPTAAYHVGGVLSFGPDGMLYATVGDVGDPANAQDLLTRAGKVLRMNPNGSIPADNPFYGNPAADPYVFTYGHRNLFGLAFPTATPNPYVTENGPDCNDEINLLFGGSNYGWGPTANCLLPFPAPVNTNLDGPSPLFPIFFYGTPVAPTNAVVYSGGMFPAFRDDLVLGEWNTGDLRVLELAAPNFDNVTTTQVLVTAPAGILDVEQGPDGALWLTTPFALYRFYDSAAVQVPGPPIGVALSLAGPDLNLTWSPPNPASGLDHFNLYRGGVPTADGCPDPGTFLASVPMWTRSFVDPGLASDTNAYFYSVRAASALGAEDPGCIQVGKIALALSAGVSHVSTPFLPTNGTSSAVFAPLGAAFVGAGAFDPVIGWVFQNASGSSNPFTITPGMGLRVVTTGPALFPVVGRVPTQPASRAIAFPEPGWYFVGVPTFASGGLSLPTAFDNHGLAGAWDRAAVYVPDAYDSWRQYDVADATFQDLAAIYGGTGCWIRITAAGAWTPPLV